MAYCSLRNKVVVITGASSGIGAAAAVEFAKHGCRLVIHGRNKETLNITKAKCIEAGLEDKEVPTALGDLMEEATVDEIVTNTCDSFGSLDILDPIATSYSIMKTAQDQLSNMTAMSLADKGVRVNAIRPGVVDTDIDRRMVGKEVSDQISADAASNSPLGNKLATAEDIARLVIFLASEESGCLTGTTIDCDRGWSRTTTGINLKEERYIA